MPRPGVVSLRNLWLIARREYRERIRTRGFVITTVLIPVVMIGFSLGTMLLSAKSNTPVRIAVVSPDTQLALDLQSELERQQQEKERASAADTDGAIAAAIRHQSTISVDAIDPGPNTRAEMDRDLESNEFDGYLWITPASTPAGRPSFTFTPRTKAEAYLRNTFADALTKVLAREALAHRGIVAADADTMLQPVQVVAAHRSRRDDSTFAQITVSALFFIMYLVIMLYGMNVARSIIEEKTSRIFEVLLATVRPEAMMAGKILGVGSVGLTQVAIWVGAAALLATGSMAMHLGGDAFRFSISITQVIFFFVFFILGYLFYACIAAALGAMTNSEQELGQLNMLLVMPLLVCFTMLGPLLSAPDGKLARIFAFFPPFTPLIMYLRVALGHPAAWEVALSILLTSASICLIVWVTSRIYRVGVLMYGKRPSLPEILRWLKYS